MEKKVFELVENASDIETFLANMADDCQIRRLYSISVVWAYCYLNLNIFDNSLCNCFCCIVKKIGDSGNGWKKRSEIFVSLKLFQLF